jgi:hypothetical protein
MRADYPLVLAMKTPWMRLERLGGTAIKHQALPEPITMDFTYGRIRMKSSKEQQRPSHQMLSPAKEVLSLRSAQSCACYEMRVGRVNSKVVPYVHLSV